jgi:hypothetical protein
VAQLDPNAFEVSFLSLLGNDRRFSLTPFKHAGLQR